MIPLCVCVHMYIYTYIHTHVFKMFNRTNSLWFFRTSFLEILHILFKVVLKMQSIYGLKSLGVEGLEITKQVKTAVRSKQDFDSPPGNRHPVYPE